MGSEDLPSSMTTKYENVAANTRCYIEYSEIVRIAYDEMCKVVERVGVEKSDEGEPK